MQLNTTANAADAAHRMTALPKPSDRQGHAATAVPQPADALGFPPSRQEAREAGAGQPVLALSSADAVALGDAGGFEDLPTVLVANLIVAYLGSAGLATIRNLATLYPDFRGPIRQAVNADPVFQSLGTLLPPMRVIALRDLLWAAPARAGTNKMTQRQYSQATDALHQPGWLPIVEQLVAHKVDGVRPEHTALLALCDSMLRDERLERATMNDSTCLAGAIQLNVKRCQQVMGLVWLRQQGQVMRDLDTDIGLLRKEVLRDALARITHAFAAEEGWTVQGLTTPVDG